MPSGVYKRPTLKDRFDRGYSVALSGCWEWSKEVNDQGYGFIWSEGKGVKAHRVSYELHNGPIPEGMVVLHKCDNTICVNPEHLQLGTQADNVQDCINKGRARKVGVCGAANGNSKESRERRNEGKT